MALFWIAAAFVGATTVSYVMTQKAKKAAQRAADAMAGVLVNKESNIEPIPVIYGTRRVGGVRVFVSTRDASGGDPNEFLYIAMVLAEGEVDAITDIHIDDTPISDSKYNGLYTVNVHTGADNQAYDSLLTQANAGWTTAHKLSGVAYLAIKLKWDSDVFQGVPDITALVRGRKVYDPRSPSAANAYSTNPALCLRDYMTNARFGKGLPASAIDDVAFSAAATDCDESVIFYYGSGSGKIFETNAVLQTDETLFSNIEKMLMGCRGFLPYTQGKYGLIIDKSRSVSYAFDTDTMVSGISIQGESKENKFNRVIVKFANPAVDYQPDQATWPDAGSSEETTFLSEDNGTLLVTDLDMPTVTNYYAARDLARVILKRSRSSLRCSFKTTSEALQLSVGDVVTVTHPTPAWVAKPFQIEEITLNYDGTCSVSLLQYDSTIYTYDLAAEEITYPASVLPNPFSVVPPTSFVTSATTSVALDGTIIPAIEASWTASTDSFVTQYDLQWSTDNTNFQSVVTDNTRFIVSPVISAATYYFKVRSINSLGVKSVFVTANQGSVGDTTAPALPTALSATAGYKSINLEWTNPTDKDFSNTEVYRATSSGGTYAEVATVGGGFGVKAEFLNGGLADATAFYYKFKSVDYSGNKSAFTGVVSATTNAAAINGTNGTDGTDGTDGTNGTNGTDGTDGTDGSNGAAGPRNADGYLYYSVSQANAPASPSATSYNFVTGSFGGLTANWSTTPPTSTGGDAKYWATYWHVTEATFGGTQTRTFNTPFNSVQFDGLVTFTNLNSELGNASSTQITTINGGLLKTGTVDASVVTVANLNATNITAGTINSDRLNVDTLNVKYLADVDTKIYDHNGTARNLTLEALNYIQKGTGGTAYQGIVPITLTGVRDGARYLFFFSGVLGDITGWKVQISTNGTTWTTAAGGNSSITWNANTYRGYTYAYTGTASIPSGSSTLYARVYTGTLANYTYAALNGLVFNTG